MLFPATITTERATAKTRTITVRIMKTKNVMSKPWFSAGCSAWRAWLEPESICERVSGRISIGGTEGGKSKELTCRLYYENIIIFQP